MTTVLRDLMSFARESEHKTVAVCTQDGRSSCAVTMPVHLLEDAISEIERLRITDEEQAALVSAIGYCVFDGQRETLERMLERICQDDGGKG